MLSLALLTVAIQTSSPYQSVPILGWTAQVEKKLIQTQPKLWRGVQIELERQLQGIIRMVPEPALGKIQRVPIWIHITSPETRCMAYHPGAQWLREHKMNPAMEKGIEIGHAKTFLEWTYEQPWMILHELAHAYHDRDLADGYENADVKSAFEAAMRKGTYASVMHWNGKMAKAYATTNQMEYFAEVSEAYFGQNDFYPFVKAELQTADPEGFQMLTRVWGVVTKKIPKS